MNLYLGLIGLFDFLQFIVADLGGGGDGSLLLSKQGRYPPRRPMAVRGRIAPVNQPRSPFKNSGSATATYSLFEIHSLDDMKTICLRSIWNNFVDKNKIKMCRFSL